MPQIWHCDYTKTAEANFLKHSKAQPKDWFKDLLIRYTSSNSKTCSLAQSETSGSKDANFSVVMHGVQD